MIVIQVWIIYTFFVFFLLFSNDWDLLKALLKLQDLCVLLNFCSFSNFTAACVMLLLLGCGCCCLRFVAAAYFNFIALNANLCGLVVVIIISFIASFPLLRKCENLLNSQKPLTQMNKAGYAEISAFSYAFAYLCNCQLFMPVALSRWRFFLIQQC